MVYYNSENNLRELKNKILASKVSDTEILEFIQDINNTTNFNNVSCNLLVLEIYILLKRIGNFIPMIDISLERIPAAIIFSDSKETAVQATAAKPVTRCDCNKPKCDADIDDDELKLKIINVWSPFKKDADDGLKFPAPGETGNVFFTDEGTIPGKKYHCEVQIDSEGNILKFLSGPTEILSAENYEEIYAGLVGQLFDFQKAT